MIKLNLIYTDTDSLIISVKTDDIYKDMLENDKIYMIFQNIQQKIIQIMI